MNVELSIRFMTEISGSFGPDCETYPGYAWDFLSRNPSYRKDYLAHRPTGLNPQSTSQGGKIREEQPCDRAARKWGLKTFANPYQSALQGFVLWRPSAYSAALQVDYASSGREQSADKSFNLSALNCCRQHFVDANQTRYTVLKSANFWIQIYGKTQSPLDEKGYFSVIFTGQAGARRRIDALRQLTSLSRDGVEDFALIGRQKTRLRLRNALTAYDIHAGGGSYRDIAIALFGEALVSQNWDPAGGYLKNRAVRAYKRGDRLVHKDYLKLLSKKAI